MSHYDQNQPVANNTLTEPCSPNGEKEYVRPRMDYLRDYEITIRFLSLGCIVRVGCKEIAFTSIPEAMNEINAYVNNPRALEQKYSKLFNEQK